MAHTKCATWLLWHLMSTRSAMWRVPIFPDDENLIHTNPNDTYINIENREGQYEGQTVSESDQSVKNSDI